MTETGRITSDFLLVDPGKEDSANNSAVLYGTNNLYVGNGASNGSRQLGDEEGMSSLSNGIDQDSLIGASPNLNLNRSQGEGPQEDRPMCIDAGFAEPSSDNDSISLLPAVHSSSSLHEDALLPAVISHKPGEALTTAAVQHERLDAASGVATTHTGDLGSKSVQAGTNDPHSGSNPGTGFGPALSTVELEPGEHQASARDHDSGANLENTGVGMELATGDVEPRFAHAPRTARASGGFAAPDTESDSSSLAGKLELLRADSLAHASTSNGVAAFGSGSGHASPTGDSDSLLLHSPANTLTSSGVAARDTRAEPASPTGGLESLRSHSPQDTPASRGSPPHASAATPLGDASALGGQAEFSNSSSGLRLDTCAALSHAAVHINGSNALEDGAAAGHMTASRAPVSTGQTAHLPDVANGGVSLHSADLLYSAVHGADMAASGLPADAGAASVPDAADLAQVADVAHGGASSADTLYSAVHGADVASLGPPVDSVAASSANAADVANGVVQSTDLLYSAVHGADVTSSGPLVDDVADNSPETAEVAHEAASLGGAAARPACAADLADTSAELADYAAELAETAADVAGKVTGLTYAAGRAASCDNDGAEHPRVDPPNGHADSIEGVSERVPAPAGDAPQDLPLGGVVHVNASTKPEALNGSEIPWTSKEGVGRGTRTDGLVDLEGASSAEPAQEADEEGRGEPEPSDRSGAAVGFGARELPGASTDAGSGGRVTCAADEDRSPTAKGSHVAGHNPEGPSDAVAVTPRAPKGFEDAEGPIWDAHATPHEQRKGESAQGSAEGPPGEAPSVPQGSENGYRGSQDTEQIVSAFHEDAIGDNGPYLSTYRADAIQSQAEPQKAQPTDGQPEPEEERVARELAALEKLAEEQLLQRQRSTGLGMGINSQYFSLGDPTTSGETFYDTELGVDAEALALHRRAMEEADARSGRPARRASQLDEPASLGFEPNGVARPFSPPPGSAVGPGFVLDEEEPGAAYEPPEYRGMLFYDGVDSLGRPVVVVNADVAVAFPATRKAALHFMLQRLEPIITQGPYVLILVSTGHTKSGRMPSGWLFTAWRSLTRPFRKNVARIILVRPSKWLKTLLTMVRPFVSKKAHRKVIMAETLAALPELTNGEVTMRHMGPRFAMAASDYILGGFSRAGSLTGSAGGGAGALGRAPSLHPEQFLMPQVPSAFAEDLTAWEGRPGSK